MKKTEKENWEIQLVDGNRGANFVKGSNLKSSGSIETVDGVGLRWWGPS